METKSCPACLQSIDARAIKCSACGSRQPDAPLMHRDVPGRVMGGVCAALSLQFGWDPVLIRVLMVVGIGATGGITLWAYALLWFLTPFEVRGSAPATKLIDGLGNLFNKERVPTAQS
jgi:phage shock protein PspC (stress-responsive transcriptional regulator)